MAEINHFHLTNIYCFFPYYWWKMFIQSYDWFVTYIFNIYIWWLLLRSSARTNWTKFLTWKFPAQVEDSDTTTHHTSKTVEFRFCAWLCFQRCAKEGWKRQQWHVAGGTHFWSIQESWQVRKVIGPNRPVVGKTNSSHVSKSAWSTAYVL